MNILHQRGKDYVLKLIDRYLTMQLKTPVKIALFSYKEIFMIAFCMPFFILICFKTGEMCFPNAKEPFFLPIIAY